MLGRHLQAIPAYQVSGIHPAFSQETYHLPPISTPEALETRACTSGELATPSERDTPQAAAPDGQGVVPNVAALPPTTPAQGAPAVPADTTQVAASKAEAVQQGSPAPSATATAANDVVLHDMNKDLDDLLAASSPSIHQHGQSRKPAAHGSSAGTPKPKRATNKAASRPPAKGNAQNAKAALEDWLDL